MRAVEIANLRNRLEASVKSSDYQKRCFVDVPSQQLQQLLDEYEKLMAEKKLADPSIKELQHKGHKCPLPPDDRDISVIAMRRNGFTWQKIGKILSVSQKRAADVHARAVVRCAAHKTASTEGEKA